MVILFTRRYLNRHPKRDQPTHFVPKLWKAWKELGYKINDYGHPSLDADSKYFEEEQEDIHPMWHHIRKGVSFKEGDYFDPKVWQGKSMASKQVSIAEPIRIVKEEPISIIRGEVFISDIPVSHANLVYLARNGGLEDSEDLLAWYNVERFRGQIIYWKDIDYI